VKRSKRIIILLAVLAAVCAATFALTRYEEKQEQIKNTDAVLLELPTDTVRTLSWLFTEDGFSFHRGEDAGWLYDTDEAFPVDDDVIDGILNNFESFSVAFIIEKVTDYGQYGLDDPECTIRLSTADSTYEIKLGNYSKMDQQRYIDIGDGNVYLASKDPMDYLKAELSTMILHDDTPSLDQVDSIVFAGASTHTIAFKEDPSLSYQPDDVYFIEQDGVFLPLDSGAVDTYLSTISSLALTNYVTYNATAEELDAFGLTEPCLSITVNYTYTDEEDKEVTDTCILHIGENAEEKQAANEAAAQALATIPDVTKYVRIGDSQIVYELTEANYTTLSAVSYNDLRHAEVFYGQFDQVTQIDVTLEEQTHSLILTANEEDEDAEPVWMYNEQEVDLSALQTALTALTADSFTDETGSQKEELSLTLHLDNEHFSQITIQLYRYDGSLCLAVVDSEPVSLVSRSAAMDLVETIQAIVLN